MNKSIQYTIVVTALFFTYAAPNVAPNNFQAISVSSTSITFTWDPLVNEANGIVQSYVITCTADNIIVVSVEFTSHAATILYLQYLLYSRLLLVVQLQWKHLMNLNLLPITLVHYNYAVTVLDGPLSDPITVTTPEQGSYSMHT